MVTKSKAIRGAVGLLEWDYFVSQRRFLEREPAPARYGDDYQITLTWENYRAIITVCYAFSLVEIHGLGQICRVLAARRERQLLRTGQRDHLTVLATVTGGFSVVNWVVQ
jgi:hypothetical protein